MTAPAAHPLELAVVAFDQAPELEVAVRRLHEHCRATDGPLRDAPITIVDNGSADGTWLVAQALAGQLDGVASRRTDQRRGTKALRGLMADSAADTVAFVRVEPDSALDALLAPLLPAVAEAPVRGLSRRSVLAATAGGAGLIALLAACASSSSTTSATATTTAGAGTTGSTAASATGSALALAAEMTQGPYYLDLNLVRSDIREDRPGLPLALSLVVVDAVGAPVKGATVDIWHCDAMGIYSGFQSASTSSNGGGAAGGGPSGGAPPSGGGPGGPGGQPPAGAPAGGGGGVANATQTDNATFLRGTQVSGADGTVAFSTVYPGWYQGRTVHIHVLVHVAGKSVHTGQLFFDDASTDALYAANAPYSTRAARDTRNANDSIYSGGGAGSVLAVAKAGTGLGAKLTLAVKTA